MRKLVYTGVIPWCVPFQGEGYEKQLKEILNAEILPIVEEFDKKQNNGT